MDFSQGFGLTPLANDPPYLVRIFAAHSFEIRGLGMRPDSQEDTLSL
jgi:hypothetical protein